MDYNLDIISSELKALDDELKHFLDKIEPVLYKDNYQIEDIDFLKTIDFQVIEMQSFNKILWPLLETDNEGILLKKSLINNLLSSLLQTKKRVDAIFENDLKTSLDKLNEYKSRFFELGYCIKFIDDFLDDLQRQRIWLFLLFAMSSNNDLFDFNELTRTASKETDLEKRKKLYLDEYDRVYMLWLKNENNFKSRINDDLVEMGECEKYDEEKDEEFQDLKRHYFDFLDKCQKAIESINFQIKNSSPTAVLIQKPIRRTIIDEIKELEDRENTLEYKAKMEEEYNSFNRKLTNKEIELVRNDCMALNDVFVRGLDIYETFFSSGTIIAENLEYLKTNPFTGLLSNNYFKANVFGSFDDDVTIGTILELCFSYTIKRIETLDFTFNSTTDLNKEPKLKELIKTILKNNFNAVLLKDNLLQLAKEIRELINLVNDFTSNETHPSDVNSEILDKNNNLLNRVLEKEDNTISTEQIFESGFVRAFIEEYYEEKIHSYYPDKDRLLYVMCSSYTEKHEVTKKQIEFTKSEIHKLGWEDLSFGYLLSCKPDSGPNFIEHNDRFIFWVKRFAEEFQDNTDTFFLVTDTINKLKDNLGFIKKLSAENGEFWEIIDKNRRPKNLNSKLHDLVNLEVNLANQIEYDIDEFEGNNIWNFGIDEYEKHIESNRAIEDLFNISELFVQLNRLQMFQELLQIPAPNEEKKIIHKQTHNNKKEISLSDFLYNKSDFDKLIKIQDEFRTYDGKRMAILIHLLQNEYRILNIISKSKTHSRKHFICLFKEDNSFDKMFAINKYIDSFSNELNLTTVFDFDADYVDIKAKLTKIIENQVV